MDDQNVPTYLLRFLLSGCRLIDGVWMAFKPRVAEQDAAIIRPHQLTHWRIVIQVHIEIAHEDLWSGMPHHEFLHVFYVGKLL